MTSRILLKGASLLGLALASPCIAVAQIETREDIAALVAEAESGSFDAMLKLGLAYDLGTVVEVDRQRALDWYLRAGRAGDPDGQFNAAVMVDAGIVPGTDDPASAVHWYTRAATNGEPRAQYNLGLIYESGDGVPVNLSLARYWFSKAAQDLPAARDRLETLPSPPSDAGLSVPGEPTGALVRLGTGRFAEMTWTARQGPPDSFFEVEILAWSPDLSSWTQPVFVGRTGGSGIVATLDRRADLFAWRVAMVSADATSSRVTGWTLMGNGTAPLPLDTPFRSSVQDEDPLGTIADRVRGTVTDAPAE